ncbi:DUF397 domain-containing protein [Streptomyces albipurpureus]|uniref:DUF397 domain-containing protein n=1 Tax=Streptomyces albipurpureus TaxID=2897419 RepID=A0ABT0UZH4_9ACTN|nr:DUF397 domain-containing protein [Streptomyces sp. CWNU-1]MCM2393972.1 DUF397 domain-containing protein [Streptomyces sp. CWNU-1]
MTDDFWQESSFCQAGNSCIGVLRDGEIIRLRESEQPNETITTTPEKMRAFIRGVKNGDFDHLLG